MVAKNDLLDAIGVIESALLGFGNGSKSRVRVYETPWGHLHAIVGSNVFRGLGIGERQIKAWEFLRQNVAERQRVLLYGITAMDEAEFDAWLREYSTRITHQMDGYDVPLEMNDDGNGSRRTG